jgi:ElaA protein
MNPEPSTIKWQVKKFDELTLMELYAILRLRNEVFVVEQACVYQDLDNRDQASWHLMGWLERKLVAYTRIMPPGMNYPEPSLGRVVSSSVIRGTGAGRQLMLLALQKTHELFGAVAIKLSAQLYLKEFYLSLGFKTSSEVYREDGIEHIEMVKLPDGKTPS